MLLLSELVEVINKAAIAATDTVRDKNLEVINHFFEYSDEIDDETAEAKNLKKFEWKSLRNFQMQCNLVLNMTKSCSELMKLHRK